MRSPLGRFLLAVGQGPTAQSYPLFVHPKRPALFLGSDVATKSSRAYAAAPRRSVTGAREPAWPAAPGPTRLAGELSNMLMPPEVPLPPARSEAPRIASPLMEPAGIRSRRLAPPEESAPPQQTVHNLEELKQQLEAALRHSPLQGRPPVTDPLAVPLPPTMPASEPKIEPKFEAPRPEAESKLKAEPKLGKPPEPGPEPQEEPEPVGKKASDIL